MRTVSCLPKSSQNDLKWRKLWSYVFNFLLDPPGKIKSNVWAALQTSKQIISDCVNMRRSVRIISKSKGTFPKIKKQIFKIFYFLELSLLVYPSKYLSDLLNTFLTMDVNADHPSVKNCLLSRDNTLRLESSFLFEVFVQRSLNKQTLVNWYLSSIHNIKLISEKLSNLNDCINLPKLINLSNKSNIIFL